MLNYETRSAGVAVAMSGQASNIPEPVLRFAPSKVKNPAPYTDDPVDSAGQALLGLVQRAAGIADANGQRARGFAAQLRAAEDRIKALEADVRYFQDRATRAEKWLLQISTEIEQRFTATDAGYQAPESPAFVRANTRRGP